MSVGDVIVGRQVAPQVERDGVVRKRDTEDSSSDNEVVVWIGAASPLLILSPGRDSVAGSGWVQNSDGSSSCQGYDTFSVELDGLYFSALAWIWSAASGYSVSVGLDGALQSGSAASGGATLTGSHGHHTARLEASCQTCSGSDAFQLIGAKISTQVVSSGTPVNATLDDASSEITYTGFTSTDSQSADLDAIKSGTFYQNTVSYTSTAGAAASFNFQGSALYIFGPTGPSFGIFQITLDGTISGVYNASTTVNTYVTLLFFITHLNTASHEVVITNQVDGQMFALDYVVAVSASGAGGTGAPTTGGGAGGGAGFTATITATSNPQSTAIFPGGGQTTSSGGGNGSAGGVIGGVIGGLAALALLFLGYRYYLYRKAGGEGDFFSALCGPRRRPPKAGNGKDDFKIWPMLRFRPKYAT